MSSPPTRCATWRPSSTRLSSSTREGHLQRGLDALTDAYVLDHVTTEPDGDALYSERVLGGWMVLKKRADVPKGQTLDLETIFNIIVEKGGRP